jgi:hypothetical protein
MTKRCVMGRLRCGHCGTEAPQHPWLGTTLLCPTSEARSKPLSASPTQSLAHTKARARVASRPPPLPQEPATWATLCIGSKMSLWGAIVAQTSQSPLKLFVFGTTLCAGRALGPWSGVLPSRAAPLAHVPASKR